jgi:hypothetical protein
MLFVQLYVCLGILSFLHVAADVEMPKVPNSPLPPYVVVVVLYLLVWPLFEVLYVLTRLRLWWQR